MTFQTPGVVTAAFTALSQVTDWLFVKGGAQVAVSVSGTFVGTVRLSRATVKDSPVLGQWITKANYAAPAEANVMTPADGWWRLECAAYTSGTINVALRVDSNEMGTVFQPHHYVSATFTALDQVTDSVLVRGGGWIAAQLGSGTFSATAVLERSFDGGATWAIVDPTVTCEEFQMGATCLCRIRCSAFTSGAMPVFLAVGSGN